MLSSRLCWLAASLIGVSTSSPPGLVKIVTFDNSPSTTLKWEVVTDHDAMKVGNSRGTFGTEESEKLALFNGTVNFVEQIKSPGFVAAFGNPQDHRCR